MLAFGTSYRSEVVRWITESLPRYLWELNIKDAKASETALEVLRWSACLCGKDRSDALQKPVSSLGCHILILLHAKLVQIEKHFRLCRSSMPLKSHWHPSFRSIILVTDELKDRMNVCQRMYNEGLAVCCHTLTSTHAWTYQPELSALFEEGWRGSLLVSTWLPSLPLVCAVAHITKSNDRRY